jgi:c-di-GMP-binding flagellar brake protein YcgR
MIVPLDKHTAYHYTCKERNDAGNDKQLPIWDHRRRSMPYSGLRRDTRYDFPATIEYVMGSQTGDEAVHKGVTINLSLTGLGLYIFDLLPEGQQITIKSALPVDARTATICWTRKEDDNFYRTGLKFI